MQFTPGKVDYFKTFLDNLIKYSDELFAFSKRAK